MSRRRGVGGANNDASTLDAPLLPIREALDTTPHRIPNKNSNIQNTTAANDNTNDDPRRHHPHNDGSDHSDHDDDDDDERGSDAAESSVDSEDEAARREEEAERQRKIDMLRKIARRLQPKVRHGAERNESWDRILRVKETHVFVISMIGLALSVFMSYFKFANRCVEDATGQCSLISALGQPPGTALKTATLDNTREYLQSTRMVILGLQGLLTLSTGVCVVLLAQLYSLQLRDRRMEWSGLTELELVEASGAEQTSRRHIFESSYSFWESSLRYRLAMEVLVHLIHPVAFIEYQAPGMQTLYEISEAFIFLRIYLFIRILYINSHIYRFRADIVSGNRELARQGFRVSLSAAFKITFYNHPGMVMFTMMTLGTLVFGFWIFVIERNGNADFESLWDCYWFVWVTLATVGYGDRSPISITGRICTIIMALFSLFVMTIFGGIITNLLAPTREQKYVQQFLQTRKAEEEHQRAAVYLVEVVFLDRQRRKFDRSATSAASLGMRSPAVYQAIKRFRRCRLALRQTLGAAADPVVDAKLQKIFFEAKTLNDLLDEQARSIIELEHRVVESCAFVRAKLHSGGRVVDIPRPQWRSSAATHAGNASQQQQQ